MKKAKIIIGLLFVFSTSFVCGCKGEDRVDPYTITYSFEDSFQVAQNVYEGELIKIEEVDGKYKLIVNIEVVYKGDYIPAENIEDVFEYSNYIITKSSIEDFVEVGGKYFFMTGKDEGYKPSIDDSNVLNNCYRLIRIFEDGSIKQDADKFSDYPTVFVGGDPPKNYDEMVSRIYDFDYYASFFKVYCGIETMSEVYEEAEDVYIGKVIESTGIIYIDNPEETIIDMPIPLFKIKVEIKNVYKGDYVPGDVVEDIVCLDFLTFDNCTSTKNWLVFSGGIFDCGYTLNDEIWNVL